MKIQKLIKYVIYPFISNYEDENIKYDTLIKGNQAQYGVIITKNNITKIMKKDGQTITATFSKLKARLPRFDEVYGYEKCLTSNNKCPLWLVNYLNTSSYYSVESGKINNSGIKGYWTLASSAISVFPQEAWNINYNGNLLRTVSGDTDENGVRPVINIKL